jgi:hypothetical protein
MAYVVLDANNNVVALFGCAQNSPQPAGYAVISDDDPRIATFTSANTLRQAPPAITFLQFMALFTPTEQATIVSTTDVQTKLFLLMATGAGQIALSDPQVIAGVNYIAAAPPGLIAPSRVATILAGAPPS